MKLADYLPEVPALVGYGNRLSELANFTQMLQKAQGETYTAPTVGLDQAVNTWIRQQMAYRQQMVLDLYTLAMTVEEIRAPIHHIVSEVFRRGIHWKPKFAVKCPTCNSEYQEDIKECTRCTDKLQLVKPDEEQKENLDAFMHDANIFDQSLEDVLKEFFFDVNALDDGFLYIAKEYIDEGDKISSRPLEIRRLPPNFIEIDFDLNGIPKNNNFICLIHRDRDPAKTKFEKCLDCDRPLLPVMYKYYNRGKTMYLLDSEIIHASKFYPSESYGWSPILTIFEKALTIIGMDKNVYRYFFERKMPASMVMVFTDEPESLRAERENMATRMRADPNYIPMLAVSTKNQRGRADMIRLFHTLQEMDYLPVRQEIRERIAAMWGVSPAWQGAPEAFGGLSTQTQQLVVTSRVVESDQRLFHEKVFPNLLEAFGVTDWELELPQPEEKAEATRIAFAQQRISAANMLKSMGFDVKLKSGEAGIDDIDFIVSGEAKSQQDMLGGQQDMFGGGGGIPNQSVQGQGGEAQSQYAKSNDTGIMQKAQTWISQIQEKGFIAPIVRSIAPDGSSIRFEAGKETFIAKFIDGKLIDISKLEPPRLHQHGSYPPHDINQPHQDNRAVPQVDKVFGPEMPEAI